MKNTLCVHVTQLATVTRGVLPSRNAGKPARASLFIPMELAGHQEIKLRQAFALIWFYTAVDLRPSINPGNGG